MAMTEDTADDFLIRNRRWILLGITLVGGVLRFALLDRPPLWADEAYTYSRVCGTYREMLDVLKYDGFPPLHYEGYWLLGRTCRLTPAQMRLIPAAAGTAMIPAMYFLAVQITGRRRTALLAALFTCLSAYLLSYSRDAKMYMAAWLLAALCIACFGWWVRSRLRVAWLAFVACGLAMAGLHLATLAVLVVPVAVMLSVPRRARSWRAWAALAAGIIVIVAGPAGYQLGFNRWSERIDEVGFASASGLAWVETVNMGRSGPDLVVSAGTAHVYGWEWPSVFFRALVFRTPTDVTHAYMTGAGVLGLLLAAGAVAWMRRRSSRAADDARAPDATDMGSDSLALDYARPSTVYAAPAPAPLPHADDETSAIAGWRQTLWLGLWILVPAYGVYCTSVRHFASPHDWYVVVRDFAGGRWFLLAAAAVVTAIIGHFRPVVPRYLAGAVPTTGLLLLLIVIVRAPPAQSTDAGWRAYWPIATRWWDMATDSGVLLALATLLLVIAWQNCGEDLRSRAARAGEFMLVVAALVAACWVVNLYFQHEFDRRVASTIARHPDVPQWDGLVRQAEQTARRRGSPIAQDAAEREVAGELVWQKWSSIWQPRYLGMIWPAVAIAVCALLMRLPTRPLRWSAVAVLLALNVAQATARILAGTEPPADRMAADVAAAQGSGGETRTWLNEILQVAVGDRMSNQAAQVRYYLAQIAPQRPHPQDFRELPFAPSGKLWEPWKLTLWYDQPPRNIARETQAAPQIKRIIVWDVIARGGPQSDNDELLRLLGNDWQRKSEQIYPVRLHWTWSDLATWRRREYVKRG
jgi:hypothetical protein